MPNRVGAPSHPAREGAPQSGVRRRVRPEELESPPLSADSGAAPAKVVALRPLPAPPVEELALEDAVPLRGDAALAALLLGSLALAGAWVTAFSSF